MRYGTARTGLEPVFHPWHLRALDDNIESRGAGLLVRRGPRLQLQRSGALQRGSGEAGEGALAEVSEEASGVDFLYDYSH